MVREQKTTRLRLTYAGKAYTILVNSIKFEETLVINRLKVGHTRYWLILQNGGWRLIGDMPVCKKLKIILIRKIAAWHGYPPVNECDVQNRQESFKTGILLNAVLFIMTLKNNVS